MMSILPNNNLKILVSRNNLTIYEKMGVDGKNISFSQGLNSIIESLKKAIPLDPNSKKNKEVEIIFTADMSFICSAKKTPTDLLAIADQILPYSSEDADFFIVKNEEINTVFASPNPTKKLLFKCFSDKLSIVKSYPLILHFSPNFLINIPNKSKTILTCLNIKNNLVVILNHKDHVVDYQIYKPVESEKILPELIQFYKTDQDFNLDVDTVVTDSQSITKIENINFIKVQPISTSLDELIVSNFSKTKHLEIISAEQIKKLEANLSSEKDIEESSLPENTGSKKPSQKIVASISILAILLVVLGIVIYTQFQSTKSKNIRKNGTVAPAIKTEPTIIPSQKFSQPKTTPQILVVPSSESAQQQ